MKIPCETCIVRPICQIKHGGECPELDYWIRLSTVERYLEKHPNSSINSLNTFPVSEFYVSRG